MLLISILCSLGQNPTNSSRTLISNVQFVFAVASFFVLDLDPRHMSMIKAGIGAIRPQALHHPRLRWLLGIRDKPYGWARLVRAASIEEHEDASASAMHSQMQHESGVMKTMTDERPINIKPFELLPAMPPESALDFERVDRRESALQSVLRAARPESERERDCERNDTALSLALFGARRVPDEI